MSDRWRYYSGYAQDDWRISNALTVNYGVRYEYTRRPGKATTRRSSNFNPTPPNPGADGRPGASEFAGGARSHRKKSMTRPGPGLGPRLGIVYSVNEDTVVRLSGARIFGSVKNTGGSSRRNGFIGGYNDRAGVAGKLGVQLGSGLAVVAGGRRSWFRTRSTAAAFHTGSRMTPRLPELLLDTQRAAITRPLRRGGTPPAARATPDDEPSEPQSGRPRVLLRLRPYTGCRRSV